MPNATVENASVHEGELIGKMITFDLTLFLTLDTLCVSTHYLGTASKSYMSNFVAPFKMNNLTLTGL